MFKTIGKVIIILAIAALISYGLYGVVQNGNLGNTSFGSDHEFSRINNPNQTTVSFVSQTGPAEGFREHDGGASAFGIFGAIGTALQIGLITLIVVSLQKGVKILSRNRRINSNSYA